LPDIHVTVVLGPPEEWYIQLPITPTPYPGTPTPSPQYYMMDIISVWNETQQLDYLLGRHHYDVSSGLSRGKIELTPLPLGTPRPSPSDDILMQVSYFPPPNPLTGQYGYAVYIGSAISGIAYGYAHVAHMHKYCPRSASPDTGYLFYTTYPYFSIPGKEIASVSQSASFADIARFPDGFYGLLPDHLELQFLSEFNLQPQPNQYANPLVFLDEFDPGAAVPFMLTKPSEWPVITQRLPTWMMK